MGHKEKEAITNKESSFHYAIPYRQRTDTTGTHHAANSTFWSNFNSSSNEIFTVLCLKLFANIHKFWNVCTSWGCKYHTRYCFLQIYGAVPTRRVLQHLNNARNDLMDKTKITLKNLDHIILSEK